MGSLGEDLILDFKPQFVPKMISDLIKQVSMIDDVNEKVSRLNAVVKRFEDELKKIEAFKRELPLCMVLLNDVIVLLKEESMQLQRVACSKNQQPVLEEFIPLNRSRDDQDHVEGVLIRNDSKDFRDKKNWMSSVQLWNSDDHSAKDSVSGQKPESKVKKNENTSESGSTIWGCKSKSEVMDAAPFDLRPSFSREEDGSRVVLPVPGLSLLAPGIKNSKEEFGSAGLRISCSGGVSSSNANSQLNLQNGAQTPQQQSARKQRRCWSPELHRRFINALERLGGCQAATPKQIRELMQVDGLTNDEVKSHLQKYRLHTRRVPNSTSAPGNQSTGLGSLLVSQDHYSDSAKPAASQSRSPEGPLHLNGHIGGTSTTGGDSMEDEEDAKSEAYSWKDHIFKPGKDDV